MTRLLALTLLLGLAAGAQAQADPEVAPADLSLTLAADAQQSAVGSTLTYTVTVHNESDVPAVGVQVAGPARAETDGAEFLEAIPFQGSFDAETGLWTVGEVGPGAEAVMLVQIRVERAGGFAGCAEIAAAAQPDPDSTPYSGDTPEDDYACVQIETVE